MYRLRDPSGEEVPIATQPEDLDSFEPSDLFYLTSSGDPIPFTKHRVARGFLGTAREVQSMASRFQMQYGSYGNTSWPEFSEDVPELIFNRIFTVNAQVWDGPAELQQMNFDETAPGANIYVPGMEQEWERWLAYKTEASRDSPLGYLAPLDMTLSLPFVLSLS
jgi:hypothetical protein